jgi:hypothetical protein
MQRKFMTPYLTHLTVPQRQLCQLTFFLFNEKKERGKELP